MSKKTKDANDKNNKQPVEPITDSAAQPPAPMSDDAKKAQEEGAKLAEENQSLVDAIEALAKKTEETVDGFKAINDDFKGRYLTAEAEESLYNKTYTAIRCARTEVYQICHDEGLTVAEKNAKLQELLNQMKECFGEISEAYVKAHMKAEDGGPADDGEVADDNKAKPADVIDLQDAKNKNGNAAEYVPPADTNTPAPVQDNNAQILSSSTQLRDSVAALIESQEARKKLVDMKQYAVEAVERQKLEGDAHKAVLALVGKMIHPHTTNEQIEDGIKNAIQLVKTGQATERLNKMGLDQPQGAGMSRLTDVKAVHSLGADHLAGVKLLTDSFSHASNKYSLSYKEAEKVPPKLQQILDRFDQRNAGKLAQEKRFLMDKLEAEGKDKNGKTAQLFDASGAADFNTPATLSRIVLMEVYSADILREITDFGTMDNHRDSVPITRWRRDDAAKSSTFRPSVLQRHSVRTGELSPMAAGKLTTEFFDIDAVARKLQATLSLEFITRSEGRTDIAGTAMAIKNLQDEIKRILLMDVFFEQIRAAAFHGATAFTILKAGTGTDTYRIIGTDDADTTTIVPNDPRSPLQVFLGTTSANRTEVPEYGSTNVGGGPSNAFWYVVEHSTSKISFVDAAGVAQNTASAADIIQVVGYKADKEKRFDLTLPGSTTQEQHMNTLLFACSDQKAALASGGISNIGYYDPTTILASTVTSELMKQAAAYQNDGRRNAYGADAEVTEGNYGFTAGMAHWGSKIFPDDFAVIGSKDGVVFRVFKPTNLRGPVEARDSSGQLIGGEEYYAYQEDAIDTPLKEKFGLVTFYRS